MTRNPKKELDTLIAVRALDDRVRRGMDPCTCSWSPSTCPLHNLTAATLTDLELYAMSHASPAAGLSLGDAARIVIQAYREDRS
jgi:hypothetical protein